MLRPMFASVAQTYDFANKLLTFGFDKQWREACAKEPTRGRFVIDLCCGTGDLSLCLYPTLGSESLLVGLDFSKEMMRKAAEKKNKIEQMEKNSTATNGSSGKGKSNFTLMIADAANLPLKNECIDDIRISFSFRNLIYKNPKAVTYLKEASRVLKKTAKLTCIETSQPKNHFVRGCFHFYCLTIVPFIGGIISGRNAPYRYLGKSAANFPMPQDVLTMLKKAGFEKAKFKPLFLGVVGLYVAKK